MVSSIECYSGSRVCVLEPAVPTVRCHLAERPIVAPACHSKTMQTGLLLRCNLGLLAVNLFLFPRSPHSLKSTWAAHKWCKAHNVHSIAVTGHWLNGGPQDRILNAHTLLVSLRQCAKIITRPCFQQVVLRCSQIDLWAFRNNLYRGCYQRHSDQSVLLSCNKQWHSA
jgi:hypothetical protein